MIEIRFVDTTADAALSVADLSYAYKRGAVALNGVSFRAEQGRFTALLGPNGAGKSTLFALATGLLAQASGEIRVCGSDIRTQPGPALSSMGLVFQQPTLDLDLTVEQNLRYFAALHGLPGNRTRDRILTELTRLNLLPVAKAKVRSLNGGHRRRVEIARALLHEPRLLLLDEPTVGLDVPTRQTIVDHVHALCRNDGIGVLWATHLIDEVAENDYVVVLHQGGIAAQGEVPHILRQQGAKNIGGAFEGLISPLKEAAAQ